MNGVRALLHRLLHPALCRLEFRPDGVRCRRGQPPARWLSACGEVAREFGLRAGWLEVFEQRQALALRTSANVPANARQRFRNLLGVELSGLRPPRRRR